MKSMNLFGGNDKSSEELFGDSKPKKKTYSENFKKKAVKLASGIGVAKAAEELGVSTNSIYSWKKNLEEKPLAKSLSPAPIQDKDGNLTFELEGKTYSLNVNSKEERERVKKEVNANSLTQYDWFKEETGNKHWVLYDTEMFEVRKIKNGPRFLRYKDECTLAPEIPINASSCAFMFAFSKDRTRIDLAKLNTEGIVDMQAMFAFCPNLKYLDTSMLKTDSALNTIDMFKGCRSLAKLDLRNAAMFGVKKTRGMFASCVSLEKIVVSKRFNTSKVLDSYNMFSNCRSLPNYRKGIMAQVLMVKPVKNGGYLTYVTNSITARQRKLLSD